VGRMEFGSSVVPELRQIFGRSRIIGVLTRAGKTVKAIIDVGDFLDLRGNASKSPEWNGGRYHDPGVHLSVLIQEQILTWDPADISPGGIHIRRPADRAKPKAR
jgi:hypothetical protein